MKSILVIFGKELPKKSKKWRQRFDEVLGPEEIKKFTNPGSFPEAYSLVNKITEITDDNGKKISKSVNYKEYELWWMHYDAMFERFCIPYVQYSNLLLHLKNFEKIYLFEPPWPFLFKYFLEAHNRQCIILKQFRLRHLMPFPFGIFLQILLSIIFLPVLMISRPRTMICVGDKFDNPHDYDFRAKFIYEELRKRKFFFVEFIRSLESWRIVLQHAWRRKRPVFYSTAIIEILHFFTRKINQPVPSFSGSDPEERFWFLVATDGLRNIKGNILAIQIMRLVLRSIGIKAAFIPAGFEGTFHELLACKLNNVKTVGIEHGAITKYFFISDFMPGFDGQKTLSVDRYGLWSEWWRDHYIKNSSAYKLEQLFVSGPMRPLEKMAVGFAPSGGPLKVLYISEEIVAPEEILPYILTLLEAKDFKLYFKFRPYRDGFELWLQENQPKLYEKILATAKILRGTMQEAISQCDVAVGSYSTAVLEALLQLKPSIFFLTNKWGDNYDMKARNLNYFFAETPQELMERIKYSREIPKEDLKKLQEQFFGNPYQNGSKWVVDQLEEFLKSSK